MSKKDTVVKENFSDSASVLERSLRVVDHVNSMLAYWDTNQVCRFANEAYELWFGKSREQMVDKITMKELLGPLYEKNLPYITGALAGKEQQFEREIKLPNGEIRNSQATYYPDIVDGKVQGFFVQVVDVSREKKIEQKLLRANQELQAIFNSATHLSIIGTDTYGVITHFSKGAETLLGYTAAEMVGKQTPEILHDTGEMITRGQELSREYNRPVTGFDVFVEPARQGKSDMREWTYVRKDATTFPVQLMVTAIRDQQGNVTGFWA